MGNARTHVFIAQDWNGGLRIGGSVPLIQPPNRFDWRSNYDNYIVWQLAIRGITDGGLPGAPANALPAAFALKARSNTKRPHSGQTYRHQSSACTT
ncbi:hypothetical protein H7H51_31505 [Mycolicibacterium farcinogenes]|nr:hypothetical protein [Mycolicibacterium farcinogenes]